jgi:3',5'-cyclic AMP phosphodiesterase CpdA
MRPLLIAQISDLHVRAPGLLSYRVVDCAALLAQCVRRILALPQRPAAVIASGDLTDLGRRDEYAHLAALLAPLPMPVFLMPGNHDARAALRAAFPGHAYLRSESPFLQYVIDDFALRVLVLDTVVEGRPEGRLDPERLAWLERALAAGRGRPTLLAMHHPPFDTLIEHMDEMGLLEGRERLAALVARHPEVERIVCGHLHRPIVARFAGTVASTAPSVAHQVELDLAPGAPALFRFEPPAFLLHAWTPDTGVISHTVYCDDYAGPYEFADD